MPQQHAKDWIDIVAAFTPLVGVIVVIVVGAMQLYVQREQWKQTLYKGRANVYWAVMDLWEALRKPDVQIDRHAFATSVLPATHLFGSDLRRFVSQIKDDLF